MVTVGQFLIVSIYSYYRISLKSRRGETRMQPCTDSVIQSYYVYC